MTTMRKYFYVAGKELYEELGDGLVRVTDRHKRTGIFKWDGPWVEGELTECSLHMLIWCGGPQLPSGCNFRWPEVPVDINRPSGWPEDLDRTLQLPSVTRK